MATASAVSKTTKRWSDSFRVAYGKKSKKSQMVISISDEQDADDEVANSLLISKNCDLSL